MKNVLIALMPVLVAGSAMAQDTARLDITVVTDRAEGSVMLALYDSEQAYESGAPLRAFQLKTAEGEGAVVIEGLKPGMYGIKAFHDVNGNGKMDTNPFGMPVEPYAFSNNAVGNMGPAKWDRAQFQVSGQTAHTLSLR